MGSECTIGEVVDLIVELGLVDPSTPGQKLEPDELDEPLSYYGFTAHEAVLALLSELEIRYTLDYKTFRGIGDADHDDRLRWYQDELESIASCTRGLVTVTNVRLVEIDAEWALHFDWNQETISWPVSAGDPDEHFEASLTFASYLSGLAASPSERFCDVDPCDEDLNGEAIFGNPEALNRLGARFGLTFS
ncbi:hypothetical protein [Nocardia australiensis]|uniref:hypothetical protein n=1 Tax=Nocardia australiensis TaxID=2887191 RepID=UPI001D13C80F|nr:hypothetical protein [Nocardia australiensis]